MSPVHLLLDLPETGEYLRVVVALKYKWVLTGFSLISF